MRADHEFDHDDLMTLSYIDGLIGLDMYRRESSRYMVFDYVMHALDPFVSKNVTYQFSSVDVKLHQRSQRA